MPLKKYAGDDDLDNYYVVSWKRSVSKDSFKTDRQQGRTVTVSRALITGASGFIGYHLARQLIRRGDQVTALVRRTSNVTGLNELKVATIEGDVGDLESLKRAVRDKDVVYHLAGLTKALRPADLLRTNVVGTENLATACQSVSKPPTLVHVSSVAAAGPAVNDQPRDETQPATPVSNYGRSKLQSEQAIRLFADRLPVTIVRPPIVFGQADTNFSKQIVGPIQRIGIHAIPGLTPNQYSLIHAEDLSLMLLAAGDRGERISKDDERSGRGIYFVEAEKRLQYCELGSLVGDALGKRVWPLRVPHAAIWTAAAVAQFAMRPIGRVPSLNIDKAREATAGSWICSGEKAELQLGFSTQKPLSDRMRETVAWCIQSPSLREG